MQAKEKGLEVRGKRNGPTPNGYAHPGSGDPSIVAPSFDGGDSEANKSRVSGASEPASAANETIHGRLRRLGKSARFDNLRVLPIAATRPAIAVSTTAPSGLSNIYQYQENPAPFLFCGGHAVPWSVDPSFTQVWCVTRYGTGTGNVGSNPPRDGTAWRCEFMADAAVVGISVLNQSSTSFRFIVDGQYVDQNASVPPGGTSTAYFTLDFTSVGGRRVRRIVVEGELSGAFLDARVAPIETISAVPTVDRLRMVVGGDSITAGTGATHVADSWAFVMADVLGIRDLWASGSGGTGYLATVGGTKYTLRQRIGDLVGPSPDIIAIAMGINDFAGGFPTAAVQAELVALLGAIRSVRETVPIFVFGSFNGTLPLAGIQAMEKGIRAVVASAAARDRNLLFVPITTAPDGPWIFGTGRVGTPRGNGNSDIYTSADGAHPTTAGHSYIGFRAADAVMAAIADTNRYP